MKHINYSVAMSEEFCNRDVYCIISVSGRKNSASLTEAASTVSMSLEQGPPEVAVKTHLTKALEELSREDRETYWQALLGAFQLP